MALKPAQTSASFSDIGLFKTYAVKVLQQTDSLGRASRFCLRTMIHWPSSIHWFRFIETHPILREAPERVKRILADKIHRPFARRDLNVAERVALLENHYKVLTRLMPEATMTKIVAGKELTLASLSGKNGEGPYRITISRDMLSQHQGELTILFHAPEIPLPMARMIINISLDPKGREILLITGIQGPGPEYKNDIVKTTRILSGLRPKRALLEVACAFAVWMKADHIIASSRTNHVSQSKVKWQRKVRADYDGFWQEQNPAVTAAGDYKLILPLPRRSIEDVAPKKRKDWQRRTALMDELYANVSQALESLT